MLTITDNFEPCDGFKPALPGIITPEEAGQVRAQAIEEGKLARWAQSKDKGKGKQRAD